MQEKAPRYRFWVVRGWAEQGHTAGQRGRWRFSLEDPRTAVRRGFATWEALSECIRMELLDETIGAQDADMGGTTVRYAWTMRPARRWMRFVAPFMRQVALWNHDVVMTEGGEGLARRIGARLLRNESRYADDARPGAAPLLGGFAVGASVAVVARQALRRR